MCYAPHLIKNPNYRSVVPLIQRTRDTTHSYIEVPCGTCGDCRARKQSDVLQRVQMESVNSYVFFFTLTYNQNSVPYATLPDGRRFMALNFKHVTDMFKRIRRQKYFGDRVVKYLCCGEYSPKRARPHYHGLLFLEKLPDDSPFEFVTLEKLVFDTLLLEWRANVAKTVAKRDTKRYHKGEIIVNTHKPFYQSLCTYKVTYRNGRRHSTYDCHYVTANDPDGSNDVSYYVSKYLFKDSSACRFLMRVCYDCVGRNNAPKLYNDLFKPHRHQSLNFGLRYDQFSYTEYLKSLSQYRLHGVPPIDISKYPDLHTKEYINTCSELSVKHDRGASFYDIYTGHAMPMCKYYFDSLAPDVQVDFLVRAMEKKNSTLVDPHLEDSKHQHRYDSRSKLVFVSDLFDDDSLLSSVEFPDDLPAPGYSGPPESYEQDPIYPDMSFDFSEEEDLPEPVIVSPLHIQLTLFNS